MENRKRKQSATGLIIKRRLWSEDDARQILEELATSGETVAAYARRRGLVPQRLSWWKKRLARYQPAVRGTELEAPASAFVPVLVRGAPEVPAAAVEMSGGVRVELRMLDGTSAAWVALLARALGGAP